MFKIGDRVRIKEETQPCYNKLGFVCGSFDENCYVVIDDDERIDGNVDAWILKNDYLEKSDIPSSEENEKQYHEWVDVREKFNREHDSQPTHERPPLGLEPKKIWVDRRYSDVVEAILRYIDKSMPIPLEWVEEYNELASKGGMK